VKEIKLSQTGKNKGKYVALVDDWNYEWLNQWKWTALKNEKRYYVQRNIRINDRHTVLKMHRLIMNTPDYLEVDHIDGNGLNCQEYNMRNCTHRENTINRKPSGRSKYLGVTINKGGYILAQIKEYGKVYNLGSFKTEELAALAYDKAAKKIHGEFANLNFK
jgi:hypothetical protein